MKNCNNCIWCDKCKSTTRCEYYSPANGEENIAIMEYKESLRERDQDYLSIVEEQNN